VVDSKHVVMMHAVPITPIAPRLSKTPQVSHLVRFSSGSFVFLYVLQLAVKVVFAFATELRSIFEVLTATLLIM